MWKRRLVWGVWLFFAALLYFFENNLGTRTLLGASVLLPCLSILLAAIAASQASVCISAPQECKKNTQTACAVQVKGLLPGTLFCGCFSAENPLTAESAQTDLILSSAAPHPVSLTAAHCGMLKLFISDGRVQDLFGLWRSAPCSCGTARTLIKPTLFPIAISFAPSATVSPDGDRFSARCPGFDPSETYAIREYLPGDPIRQIHWKLSEKVGTPMLRELGLPLEDKTLLLLDTALPLHGNSAARIDAAAEAILSLSAALLQSGIVHSIGWKNRVLDEPELHEIRSEEEWRTMQESLLSQSAAPDEESVCTCFHKWQGETVYAHTVVCAAIPPQDLSVLSGGNRLTLLLFEEADFAETVPNVFVRTCPPQDAPAALQQLEI